MKESKKAAYTDYDMNEALMYLSVICLFPLLDIFMLKILGGLFIVFYFLFSKLTKISWKSSVLYRIWIFSVFLFYMGVGFYNQFYSNSYVFKRVIIYSYLFFGIGYILLWFWVLKKRVGCNNG